MVRHVALVGLMASGKTTVGRGLAEALDWPFSDSDASIERERGTTVRALADEVGVDAMHELEGAHLLQALAAARAERRGRSGEHDRRRRVSDGARRPRASR